MPKRYTVAPGHTFTYPADPISLRLMRDAHGDLNNVPEKERHHVKHKTVSSGQDCGDMPVGALAVYLSRGWVIEEVIPEVTPPKSDEALT